MWFLVATARLDRLGFSLSRCPARTDTFYQNPAKYRMWRSLLYKELDGWYKEHQPSKKHKSHGTASGSPSVVFDSDFTVLEATTRQQLASLWLRR
jgi:hypothetical protein